MARVTELRETHISQDSADRSQWVIVTNDPYWQRRLGRITKPVRTSGEMYEYKLTADQMLFRKGKRPVSDRQRNAGAGNLARRGKTPSPTKTFSPRNERADKEAGNLRKWGKMPDWEGLTSQNGEAELYDN